MQKSGYVKNSLTVLFIIIAILLAWNRYQNRSENRNKELVESIIYSGHRYDLYFHPKAPFYNTITKDGVVIFDGRKRPDLHSCIQQLEVQSSKIFRRCYVQAERRVDREQLP